MRSWWFIPGMRLTRANPRGQMEAARSMRREKKTQKRPPRCLAPQSDGAASSRRDNTEASRLRSASLAALQRWLQIKAGLASQAKIYATTDAPRDA